MTSPTDDNIGETLSISMPAQPGAAPLTANLNRITVLLGANGSGKSRTLKWLASHLPPAGNVVIYVEGGRAIQLEERETPETRNLRDADAADKHYTQHKRTSLSKRLVTIFRVIKRKMEKERIAHSTNVGEWQKEGYSGPCPQLEEQPDEKLARLFNEIFSEVQLVSKQGVFSCTRGTKSYKVKELSDGEKQALALIADIAVLGESSAIVLVDEPELNLNALLACRLWDTIERERHDLRFIYATHLLSFVMRSSVETVITLGGPLRKPMIVQEVAAIDPAELRPYLGAIPAIVSSARTLLTEGQANSIDTPIYRWLMQRNDLVVVPFSDSQQIISAVKSQGVWQHIAATVAIAGIIDRDFRSSEQLNKIARSNITILELHEIESYLCLPDLVTQIASSIGASITVGDVEKLIRINAETSIVRVATLRAIERLRVLISPALVAGVLRSITLLDDAKALLESALVEQKARLDGVISPSVAIDQEHSRCREIIDSGDYLKMLEVFEGKAIFHRIPKLIGLTGTGPYIGALCKFAKPDEIPQFPRLRDSIMSAFTTPELGLVPE